MATVRSTIKLLSGSLGLSVGAGRGRSGGGGGGGKKRASSSEEEISREEEEKVCDDRDLPAPASAAEEEEEEEEETCDPQEQQADLAAKLAAAVDDWELLSEKSSATGGGGTAVFVSQNGSVRSISVSVEHAHSGSCTGSSPRVRQHGGPGLLQRSPSNSTIASEDCCSLQGAGGTPGSSPAKAVVSGVGTSGAYSTSSGAPFQGLPGVDYVEHVVLPTDTLQGICLSYKISATRLRQANRFSGNSLLGAPKKLVVPLQRNGVKTGAVRMQDRTTREYKVCAFLAEEEGMGPKDAKSYLEQTNWILEDALLAARADKEWEPSPNKQGSPSACASALGQNIGAPSSAPRAQDEHGYDDCSHRSGDIRITLRVSEEGVPLSATLRAGGGGDDDGGGSVGSGGRRGVALGIPRSPAATPKRKNRKNDKKRRAKAAAVPTASESAVNQSTCTARDILEHASGTRHYDGRAIELQDLSSS